MNANRITIPMTNSITIPMLYEHKGRAHLYVTIEQRNGIEEGLDVTYLYDGYGNLIDECCTGNMLWMILSDLSAGKYA